MNFEKIKSGKIIVKEFLTIHEIKEVKRKVFDTYKIENSQNLYKPYRYPDIKWENINWYNHKSKIFEEIIGLEESFIAKLNQKIEGNSFLPVKNLVKNGLKFNPYTLRVLQPKKVDIHHHVENQAIPHYPKFFNELSNYIEVMDQYSFVLMIQQPEKGGEVVIYNEKWEGAEKVEEMRALLEKLDNEEKIQDKIEEEIALEEGDLLLFPAGIKWHKVNEVYGSKARITIGGFMGKVNDKPNTYGFWS